MLDVFKRRHGSVFFIHNNTALEQYNITDRLELILEKGRIILKPKSIPRKGWEKSFQQMHANGDDNLLIDDIFDGETFEEWK